jgi:hypothetical protein
MTVEDFFQPYKVKELEQNLVEFGGFRHHVARLAFEVLFIE